MVLAQIDKFHPQRENKDMLNWVNIMTADALETLTHQGISSHG